MSLELAHRDMVRRRMMVVANGAKRTLTEPRYRSGFMSTRPNANAAQAGIKPVKKVAKKRPAKRK